MSWLIGLTVVSLATRGTESDEPIKTEFKEKIIRVRQIRLDGFKIMQSRYK